MNSKTETIISALRILARDIQTDECVLSRLETLQRNLKEAIELAEAAAKSSPYQQTPHFWKRLHELKHGNTNS